MNWLAGMRLMETRHHHRVAKIKHFRGDKRGRRRAHTQLLLFVEGSHPSVLSNRMVAVGADLDKFVGDVRCPGSRIMRGHTGLEALPGGNDRLLRLLGGLEG